MISRRDGDDPHAGQPVRSAGPGPQSADAAVVLVHGRGATADGMLRMASEIAVEGAPVSFLAPQAHGGSWYPRSFLAPVADNEPHLTSALELLSGIVEDLDGAGVPPDRTVLLGFSQGACLALEFVARRGGRHGGVLGFSGGLIGPEVERERYGRAAMEGTTVFLGCSDRDPHVPVERVRATAEVFRGMEAEVTERIYEGMPHTVNEDELRFARELLGDLTDAPTGP